MEWILKRRSIRRFLPKPVNRQDLVSLVQAASFAPSAGNGQPWEFILVDDVRTVKQVNKNLGWLGGAPEADQEPTAHVVVLLRNPQMRPAVYADGGAAATTMCLAAAEKGIGSCWIGSVNKDEVVRALEIPADLELFAVLALGYPAEEPVVTQAGDKPSAKRDAKGVLKVEKRPLKSVCHVSHYGQRLE